MNKITLTRIDKIGRRYVVSLNRGNSFQFTNYRKAQDFLHLVNKEINESYLFISEEYMIAEGYYRDMFQYISDYQLRFSLKNSLDFLRNRLDSIPSQPETENKNFFVVSHCESCLLELMSVYRDMRELSISRSNTVLMHKLSLRCRIVTLYYNEFKIFQRVLTMKVSM